LGDPEQTDEALGRALRSAAAAALPPGGEAAAPRTSLGPSSTAGRPSWCPGRSGPTDGALRHAPVVLLAALMAAVACRVSLPKAAALGGPLIAGLMVGPLACPRKRRTLLPSTRQRLVRFYSEVKIGELKPEDVIEFWRSRFPEVSMIAVFVEAERAGRTAFSCGDFISCWEVVKDSGLDDSQVLAELDTMRAFAQSLCLFRLRAPQAQCPFSGLAGPAY